MPESMVLVAPTRVLPFLTTPVLSPLGKLRAALDLLLPARSDQSDETLYNFVCRRFGHEVAERLAVPLLASVYGGGKGDLSVLATFPQLRLLEQKYRSVLRGLRATARQRQNERSQSTFITVRSGLESLVTAALQFLRTHAHCLANAAVVRLSIRLRSFQPALYTLELADGSQIEADAVILATPAPITARLLAPLDPQVASLLDQIRYLPTIVVALAFPVEHITHALEGTGFLVPESEGLHMIACTWVSRKWPHASPPDQILLRCYVKAAPDTVLSVPDAEIVAQTVAELRNLLGIEGGPSLVRVMRWPQAVPQYAVGHLERITQIEALIQRFPGLRLAGAGYRGIGVPDCIQQGQAAAHAVFGIPAIQEHLAL